jgi:hypothetical protein
MSRLKLVVLVMTLAVLSWGINVYAPPASSAATDEAPAVVQSGGVASDPATVAADAIKKRDQAIQARRAAQQAVVDAANAAQGQKEVSK